MKRVRAAKYTKDLNDEQCPWPPMRLVGKHPLGENSSSSKHYCDYPLCKEKERKAAKLPKTPDAASGRGRGTGRGNSGGRGSRPSPVPPVPLFTGARAQAPPSAVRAPSPAPSDSSDGSTSGNSRAKFHCKSCYDPTNTRPMNFHFECYNKWHCLECVDEV